MKFKRDFISFQITDVKEAGNDKCLDVTCFHIYIHSIIHDGYLGTTRLLQKLRIKCGITLSKISSR